MKYECVEFFNNEDFLHSKCKYLADNFEKALEWERLSVSEYSPGIVEDHEIIVRQIYSPIHIDDESGEIKTAAFDDALNKGLSGNRLHHSNEEHIHKLGKSKAEHDRQTKPERQYIVTFLYKHTIKL